MQPRAAAWVVTWDGTMFDLWRAAVDRAETQAKSLHRTSGPVNSNSSIFHMGRTDAAHQLAACNILSARPGTSPLAGLLCSLLARLLRNDS
jgi:hypothetical protein